MQSEKNFALRMGIALGRHVLPFDVTNLVPTQNLRSVIGIDLLLFLID